MTRAMVIHVNKEDKKEKFMGSVKVGPKGQIVIPKEIRDMFDIEPGDTLLVLADIKRGIAIERYGIFGKIADAIFSGKAKELYPQNSEEDSIAFADQIEDADVDKESGE